MTATPWSPPTLVTPADVYLPQRQAEVLDGICAGLTNAAIGRRLYLTENTVRTHSKRLYAALGAHDRGQAVALAHQLRLWVLQNPWGRS